jgi:4-hydroxyacetophenone monooxygenase
MFSNPIKNPDIPGLETFKGDVSNPAAWDKARDYTSKRVALVGNGSTGTQLAPMVAEKAESLTIFQRTPYWIAPDPKYKMFVQPELHWLIRNMPYYWNWYSLSEIIGSEP